MSASTSKNSQKGKETNNIRKARREPMAEELKIEEPRGSFFLPIFSEYFAKFFNKKFILVLD